MSSVSSDMMKAMLAIGMFEAIEEKLTQNVGGSSDREVAKSIDELERELQNVLAKLQAHKAKLRITECDDIMDEIESAGAEYEIREKELKALKEELLESTIGLNSEYDMVNMSADSIALADKVIEKMKEVIESNEKCTLVVEKLIAVADSQSLPAHGVFLGIKEIREIKKKNVKALHKLREELTEMGEITYKAKKQQLRKAAKLKEEEELEKIEKMEKEKKIEKKMEKKEAKREMKAKAKMEIEKILNQEYYAAERELIAASRQDKVLISQKTQKTLEKEYDTLKEELTASGIKCFNDLEDMDADSILIAEKMMQKNKELMESIENTARHAKTVMDGTSDEVTKGKMLTICLENGMLLDGLQMELAQFEQIVPNVRRLLDNQQLIERESAELEILKQRLRELEAKMGM